MNDMVVLRCVDELGEKITAVSDADQFHTVLQGGEATFRWF